MGTKRTSDCIQLNLSNRRDQNRLQLSDSPVAQAGIFGVNFRRSEPGISPQFLVVSAGKLIFKFDLNLFQFFDRRVNV